MEKSKLDLSLVSYYTVCRYNYLWRNGYHYDDFYHLWGLLAEYKDAPVRTVDMICDWIMQCCYNG